MKYDFGQLTQDKFDSLIRAAVGEVTRSAERVPTGGELRVNGPLQFPATLCGNETWTDLLVLVIHISGVDQKSRIADFLRGLDAFVRTEESRRDTRDTRKDGGLYQRSGLTPFVMDAPAPQPPRAVPLRHVIVATNLASGDAAGMGDARKPGREALTDLVSSKLAPFELVRHAVWDETVLEKLLDGAPTTRRRFLPAVAPSDVLDRLEDYGVGINRDFLEVVKARLLADLLLDRYVHLVRTGTTTLHRLKLSTIGVDLPLAKSPMRAVQFVTNLADRPVHDGLDDGPSDSLLLGGPGQGKSTVVQLTAQNYRLALLTGTSVRDAQNTAAMAEVEKGLRDVRIPSPHHRRWPVKVNLPTFVEKAAGPSQMSLLRFIAEQIDPGLERVTLGEVQQWLKTWPWLVLLDGLDEVASASGRHLLIERLTAFRSDVDVKDADVVTVATSRPQGFAGELGSDQFRYVELAKLTHDEAVSYGQRFVRARYADDDVAQRTLSRRIAATVAEPLTARLMETPLQVTIMAILLEGRDQAPRSRYELFNLYYQTVYSRERDRMNEYQRGGDDDVDRDQKGQVSSAHRKLLRDHEKDIDALHDWLGIQLQVKTETMEAADATIPRRELGVALQSDLVRRGHKEKASELTGKILETATNRLVLIVSYNDDEVGFEVPSIREFFAARSIVTGEDALVLRRLEETLEPVHWRATWLFAAGRIFGSREREHLIDGILHLLERADSRDSLRATIAPGADLALDLLNDDVAAGQPLNERHLVSQALNLLQHAPDASLYGRAGNFLRLAERDDEILGQVSSAITAAAAGTVAQQKSAHVVLQAWATSTGDTARRFRRPLRELNDLFDAGQLAASGEVTLSTIAKSSEHWHRLEPRDRRLISHLDTLIGPPVAPLTGRVPGVSADDSSAIALIGELSQRLVERDPLFRILSDCVMRSSSISWVLSSGLRSILRAALQRRQIADRVRDGNPLTRRPE